jgi:Hemerythrin HHE cation binding domain
MTFQIPASLKLEHEDLHAELVMATKAGGKVGEAAKGVARVLHDHFVKEEEFALPPIGLLSALARGEVDENMKSVLRMTDRLKAELPQMLEEHKAVVAALKNLIAAAEVENKPEHARFAEKLMLHAQTEEEVLYPAAILVGEYLKLKLKT